MNLARQPILVGLCSLPLLGTAASAQQDRMQELLDRHPRYVVENANPSAKKVLIWKDSKSHDCGVSLIIGGVDQTHPEMIASLLACVVPNGTKVMLDSAGLFTHDITVIDGKHAGCQGNIASNDLQRIDGAKISN